MKNTELLEYIYKSVDMGVHSTIKLLENLSGKDNKIIETIEDIKNEYLDFQKDIEELASKYKLNLKDSGMMAKMGSSMEISMEVAKDNSDSKIADMLIRGNTMWVIEVEKNIHKFKDKTSKEVIKIAKDLLDFQNNSIKKLKEYL